MNRVGMLKLIRGALALGACAVLFSGCAWLAGPKKDLLGDTLADLQPARMPDTEARVPNVSLNDIENSYHRALEVAENDEVRRKILVRLAGLEMIRSEQNQVDATDSARFFDNAISMYEELIDLQQGRPGRDNLLYQLAKAYALDGRTEDSAQVLDQLALEYPNSPYMAEAQFRRAERAFSDGDYAAAEQYYRSVVESQEQTPFTENAIYMQGWAQFKRNQYDESLVTFTRVLDGIMEGRADLEDVTSSRRNLAEDTLHVMSLVFSYLDGPQTINETYAELGVRPYNYLLYQHLGDQYLEKKRYLDSADTFAYYIEQYPLSDYAPGFSVRIIDVYDQGDFPSELLPAKEQFVNDYGVRSNYWQQKPVAIREYLQPYLHAYLQELASYSHSRAQTLSGPPDAEVEADVLAGRQAEAGRHYQKAARWYEEFVEGFPSDEKTPNMLFLLGEAYYESGQLAKAVGAYERVAYEFADEEHGPEAGYSAILAATELIASGPEAEREQWRRHRTNSAITFADYYPNDQRAVKVLAQAAQDLLDNGEYVQAVAAARRLTEWEPPVEQPLLQTAWLVVGQGQFDLEQYAEAEYAYRQVLSLMPAEGREPNSTGPSRDQVIERVAASAYKQAEQLLAADDKAGAIEQLLRVSGLAPGTDIAISADYDAATYLMDLERWREAEQVLTAFRRNYPNHNLTPSVPAKLVVVYQALEQWRLAADELRIMAENDSDPDLRRQSLYLSAELYEQSNNIDQAIIAYRTYANTYSRPFGETLEAANKLVELHGRNGGMESRRFWLNRLISLDAKAGESRSDRSLYLAAQASSELAEDVYQDFVRIPLRLPLQDSLARKRRALENTLAAYQQILDYGVAEFSTLASYRIGEVYVQLSRALMESERPDDLNALELEQYEILLEEQAFPFEERAIDLHEANAKRSWDGLYDDWVKESFETLAKLLPARYGKEEEVIGYSHAIH
ncbi:MAG: tetratricopeptide repeat protein [Cellvibrionaceae bacterium]